MVHNHAAQDRHAARAEHARRAKAKLLSAQEATLTAEAARLNKENLNPEPSPTESERYRKDRARKTVKHLSAVKDDIARLHAKIQILSLASPSLSSDEKLQKIGETLLLHSQESANLQQRLRGLPNKEASAKLLHAEASEELGLYSKDIAKAQQVYGDEVLKRARIREGNGSYPSDHHYKDILTYAEPIVQLVIFMVVAVHVILGVPRRGGSWLFAMSAYLLQQTITRSLAPGAIIPRFLAGMLASIPIDIRSATALFNLEAKATVYAVCPKCHSIWAPDPKKAIPSYPKECKFSRYKSTCKEQLTRPKVVEGQTFYVPIKHYVAFDFKDWMGGMLSRPKYEEMMDDSWKRMTLPSDGTITDIFQGSILRNFKGPDKKTHFSVGGDEGRYVFSLSFDGFNPLGNKEAGKKISCGLISLVCLSLPAQLRYKPENMFVAGIVAGPKEPPLDRLNPYLSPLIDTFLDFWNFGVNYTRTCRFKTGRCVRCAIVAVVCDLLAARKIGGFSPHSHNFFCAICTCVRRQPKYTAKAAEEGMSEFEHDKLRQRRRDNRVTRCAGYEGLNDCEYQTWERRTNESCREHAEKWKNAPSAAKAQSYFDQSGLRWSELLRLPYFDPSRFIVVDSMHNLFLGLIMEHFRGIFGYELHKRAEEVWRVFEVNIDANAHPFKGTDKQAKCVEKLIKTLESPLNLTDDDAYAEVHKAITVSSMLLPALLYVAEALSIDLGEERKKTKAYIAGRILDWRREQQEELIPNAGGPDASATVFGHILTADEMQALWTDIENMVTPSWLTSIPHNLGSAAHGKLKSDQWRTIGSTYLPTTLVRLWSQVDPAHESKRSQFLDLTITLLSAVNIASSRVTSVANSTEYERLMYKYRRDLRTLFPDYKAKPNHHVAMHIGEYLRMYGPVHGWWTFPFERLIGMLQRITTNYKPGQYEETIGRTHYRSANLRAFISKDTCPDAVKQTKSMFDKLVAPQVRNTLVTDMLAFASADKGASGALSTGRTLGSLRPVPEDIRKALQEALSKVGIVVPPEVYLPSHLTVGGITYAIRSKHEGNSNILVLTRHGSKLPVSIINFVTFPSTNNVEAIGNTYVIARKHLELEPKLQNDPYSAFPWIRASMWSNSLDPEIRVFLPELLDNHFAKCVVSWEGREVAVVTDLSRTLLASSSEAEDLAAAFSILDLNAADTADFI